MLIKNYSKTGRVCRVTFKLPSEAAAESVALCGEYHDWDPEADPMKERKDGTFSTTVSLEPGNSYRFRYFVDEERWENDWEADLYVPNEYGSEDSVVTV